MRKKFVRPGCPHRHLQLLIECRKNFPFGRKSNPVYSFKRVWGKECKDCGKLFKLKNGNRK